MRDTRSTKVKQAERKARHAKAKKKQASYGRITDRNHATIYRHQPVPEVTAEHRRLAKSGCKHCHGTASPGLLVLRSKTEKEQKVPLLCACVMKSVIRTAKEKKEEAA